MSFDLRYYLAVVLRRLHWVLLSFAALTAVALVVAWRMTPVYESSARLLMASPQIPGSLAAPTVDTAALEQLQIVEQRLMTRLNLLEIARKYNALSNLDSLTPDEIVEGMRQGTTIVKQAGRDQATLMTITFRAPSAQASASVVNEYVTRILADNTATRTSQAQDTLQFFTQEVERLTQSMATQSAKILDFQNKNADALPDTQGFRMTQQNRLTDELSGVNRDIATLTDQRGRLIELYEKSGGLGPAPTSPETRQLDDLKTELARARGIYAPTNPKIQLLESTIASLEGKIAAQPDAATDATHEVTPLELQTAQIDAQIAQLERRAKDLTAELAKLKDAIDRSASVAVELQALQRDYEALQTQYANANDRLSKASTGERIEALAKGQRIGVLDAATVPDSPSRPNKVKMTLMGAMAGIGLGFALIVLAEVLNSAVRRPIDLERHLQITPIGVIPHLATPSEVLRRRLLIGAVLLIGVVGLPLAIFLLDRYYLPIDLIIAKITKKLGL